MIALKYCLGIFISISLVVSGNVINTSHDNSLDHVTDFSTSGCYCSNYSCGCCELIKTIKGLVCSNFSYLPNDYGISLTITYNNYTLFNETISARNPPPICVGIPELEKISAEICLRLYDLNFENKKFHGCMDLKVFVFHLIHKKFDFGCFNIPSKNQKMIFNNLVATMNLPEVIML